MQNAECGKRNRGFTLIELLVVMAISVILMGLVLAPVVQSFKMTRAAEAMVDAQDAARAAMEGISRELGEAMFVYDNTAAPINLPVRQAGGGVVPVPLEYARLDFVLPKITMHCNNPDHPDDKTRDYERGNEAWPPCPVCQSTDVEARPKMPLEQDTTIVRYFLGLRYNDPNAPHFGWKSPWGGEVAPGEENQVVLYRVEFNPYDDDLFPQGMSIGDRLSDPDFFYRGDVGPGGIPMYERWAELAHIVGIGKYEDLVIANTTDSAGNPADIDPTITFRFQAMDNDAFTGAYATDKSFEYPDAVPAVYYGTYGYWLPAPRGYNVTVYRNDYSVAYTSDVQGNDFVIWKWSCDASGNWTQDSNPINVTQYLAGTVSKEPEMVFTVDANRGAVIFALDPPRRDDQALGLVNTIDPNQINNDFHTTYEEDRGGAIRHADLITIDPAAPNCPRIVPGSERVVGPDMTPGASAPRAIRYERVPLALGDPGLNQYKIDYDTGDIFFSPVPDQDLPVTGSDETNRTMMDVTYKIQFNKSGDLVRGDYTTKSVVTIHLGMRVFDPESSKPHSVDLTNSVKVRNAAR